MTGDRGRLIASAELAEARYVALEARYVALVDRVWELREAAVKLVLPYEALLVDNESRRWLAPTLWAAIEEGVKAVRAALIAKWKAMGCTESKIWTLIERRMRSRRQWW